MHVVHGARPTLIYKQKISGQRPQLTLTYTPSQTHNYRQNSQFCYWLFFTNISELREFSPYVHREKLFKLSTSTTQPRIIKIGNQSVFLQMFLQKIQQDTDYPELIFGWFTLASLHTSESQQLAHRRYHVAGSLMPTIVIQTSLDDSHISGCGKSCGEGKVFNNRQMLFNLSTVRCFN